MVHKNFLNTAINSSANRPFSLCAFRGNKVFLRSHKEQDFRFLAFIIAGFDAATISHLTGYSVGSVYTKKNKLKKEIANLDSPYRDFYLQFFN